VYKKTVSKQEAAYQHVGYHVGGGSRQTDSGQCEQSHGFSAEGGNHQIALFPTAQRYGYLVGGGAGRMDLDRVAAGQHARTSIHPVQALQRSLLTMSTQSMLQIRLLVCSCSNLLSPYHPGDSDCVGQQMPSRDLIKTTKMGKSKCSNLASV
jgi:hypothetical protein